MKKYIMIVCLMIIFPYRVFSSEKINYLENITIENYNIDFKKDKYEYDINIDNEEYLDINYELSDDNVYVSISGNGNFNSNNNVILINVNNDYEYKINVHKSIKVSKIEDEVKREMSTSKKEIVKLFIITISSMISAYSIYLMFGIKH